MKFNTILAFTFVLALTACSGGQFLSTPTSTPTATLEPTLTATFTPQPTATMTPTALPEFTAGITHDMEYEDCNQLHEDTLKTEMPLLVAKEHAWLDTQRVTADMIGGHGLDNPLLRRTTPYISVDFGPNSDYLTSCSILHMNNGTELFILGIAVKNNMSNNIAILHFAIDDQGLSHFFNSYANGKYYSQYENYFNSKSFFNSIKKAAGLDLYRIIPQIFLLGETQPEYFADWPNTVKYMEEYEKQGVSINDYIWYVPRNLDEKEIIKKLETMVIPTKFITPPIETTFIPPSQQ